MTTKVKFNIEDILNLDFKDFKNRKNLLKYLESNYTIHPHARNKIIILDDEYYCYKFGFSSIDYKDKIVFEKKIFQQAKKEKLEMFFEEVERVGSIKNLNNGIYRQKKLIVNDNIDFETVLNNWINLYNIEKVLLFNTFLEKNELFDLNKPNIGYDPILKTYKLIDYELNPDGKDEGNKLDFDLALQKCLKEVQHE